MELVEFCKKYDAIPILSQFLNQIDSHYKAKKSFSGLTGFKVEDVIGYNDNEEINLTIEVVDSSKYFVYIFAYVDYEEEDVSLNLNENKFKVLKLFLDFFGSTQPRMNMGMGL